MDYSNEETLIRGLRNREDAAFEHLRKTSYEAIAFIATSNSGSEEDARDLYSEGIACLLEAIDKPGFEMTCKVRTLLFQICSNRYSVMMKKEKAKQNFLNENQEDAYEESLEEKMDRKIYKSIFWTSFKKLKEDCQILIKLVFENVPLKEIARRMGLTTGSLKNRKKSCLVALTGIIHAHPDYAKMIRNNEIIPD